MRCMQEVLVNIFLLLFVILDGGQAHNKGCSAAQSAQACLNVSGCNWFSYTGDCPECERIFGPQVTAVTGCNTWSPMHYCQNLIFLKVLEASLSTQNDRLLKHVVRHFEITQGTAEVGNPHHRLYTCYAWCDYSTPKECVGQPRFKHDIRGVNYGGRFIPESYLILPGTEDTLLAHVGDNVVWPAGSPIWSLCDLDVPDAGERMATFLDVNVRREHFVQMAQLGFNVVRLPLGYWHVVDFGGVLPEGPPDVLKRWLNILNLMKPSDYAKWITMVFEYARAEGLQVILDLHSIPGQQAGAADTGCRLSNDSTFYGASELNMQLSLRSVDAMAQICASWGDACFGIELINEPHTSAESPALDFPRALLARFYPDMIKIARKHMDKDKPVVLYDYPQYLEFWFSHVPHLSYTDYGRIIFSTHVYEFPHPFTTSDWVARAEFQPMLQKLQSFCAQGKYDLLVSEYGLNSHGSGSADDRFAYNSFTNWFVHQCDSCAMGSMVWNYDSYWAGWGPVKPPHVGRSRIQWKRIFADDGDTESRSSQLANTLAGILQLPRLMLVLLIVAGVAAVCIPKLNCQGSCAHRLGYASGQPSAATIQPLLCSS